MTGSGAAAPRVVIVGAPGSGKSTVGQALATYWGLPFRDTDHDIEVLTGRTISEIFVDDGEEAFRELERNAVEVALRESRGVLALGGGAISSASTRDLLVNHRVVWLQVGLANAVARVGLNRDRPLLLGSIRNTLLRLMRERAPWYESVATIVIDTDDRSVDAIVADVVGGLEEGG